MSWTDQLESIVREQRSLASVSTEAAPRVPNRVWWRMVSLPYSEDSHVFRWNSVPQNDAPSLIDEILEQTGLANYCFHIIGCLQICRRTKREIQVYIDDPEGNFRLIIEAYQA